MRGDHLDVIAVRQISAKAICRKLCRRSTAPEGVKEAVPEDAFDELALMRRSVFDTNSGHR
jgi:hypothetical protein